ncbi:hypothetical protein [Enterocloster clostridioformis]|uniref:hypothetical protein n=1 Tax=Enterocloster clostridioformis TaxID=1531 RepID=UPI001FA7D028|nr:hypothetical protein [Enterocloster clostridioformis]
MAATRDRIGISARPVVPSAIMVRNGPSFKDRIPRRLTTPAGPEHGVFLLLDAVV